MFQDSFNDGEESTIRWNVGYLLLKRRHIPEYTTFSSTAVKTWSDAAINFTSVHMVRNIQHHNTHTHTQKYSSTTRLQWSAERSSHWTFYLQFILFGIILSPGTCLSSGLFPPFFQTLFYKHLSQKNVQRSAVCSSTSVPISPCLRKCNNLRPRSLL